MSKPKTPRPVCQSCGRPLRKKTYHYDLKPGEADPTTLYDRPVVAVVRRKALTYYNPPHVQLSLWCGEWGDYADGYFCGLRCGWRFGRDVLREIAKRKASA